MIIIRNSKKCLVDSCDKTTSARGLCKNHYAYFKYYKRKGKTTDVAGYLEIVRKKQLPKEITVCLVDNCENDSELRGLCRKHYYRFDNYRRSGKVKDNIDEYLVLEKMKRIPKVITVCLAEGCERDSELKGLCRSHYVSFQSCRRRGKVADLHEYLEKKHKGKQRPACLIEGCNKEGIAQQLCEKHYNNFYYYKCKGDIHNVPEYLEFKKEKVK